MVEILISQICNAHNLTVATQFPSFFVSSTKPQNLTKGTCHTDIQSGAEEMARATGGGNNSFTSTRRHVGLELCEPSGLDIANLCSDYTISQATGEKFQASWCCGWCDVWRFDALFFCNAFRFAIALVQCPNIKDDEGQCWMSSLLPICVFLLWIVAPAFCCIPTVLE